MDYQNNTYIEKHSTGFATAALALGIAGIATGCCLYTGIICGALAIMFAILSRGGEMTMPGKSKVGLALGIIGIVLSIVIFIAALVITIASFGGIDSFWNEYNEVLNQMDSTYPYTL